MLLVSHRLRPSGLVDFVRSSGGILSQRAAAMKRCTAPRRLYRMNVSICVVRSIRDDAAQSLLRLD